MCFSSGDSDWITSAGADFDTQGMQALLHRWQKCITNLLKDSILQLRICFIKECHCTLCIYLVSMGKKMMKHYFQNDLYMSWISHNFVLQLIVLCAGNNVYHNMFVLPIIPYLWDKIHTTYLFMSVSPITSNFWDASKFKLFTDTWHDAGAGCSLAMGLGFPRGSSEAEAEMISDWNIEVFPSPPPSFCLWEQTFHRLMAIMRP